jgi:hypothetical protein
MTAVLEDFGKQAEQILKNITPEEKVEFGDQLFLVFPKIGIHIHAKTIEELVEKRGELSKIYSPAELSPSFTFFGTTELT